MTRAVVSAPWRARSASVAYAVQPHFLGCSRAEVDADQGEHPGQGRLRHTDRLPGKAQEEVGQHGPRGDQGYRGIPDPPARAGRDQQPPPQGTDRGGPPLLPGQQGSGDGRADEHERADRHRHGNRVGALDEKPEDPEGNREQERQQEEAERRHQCRRVGHGYGLRGCWCRRPRRFVGCCPVRRGCGDRGSLCCGPGRAGCGGWSAQCSRGRRRTASRLRCHTAASRFQPWRSRVSGRGRRAPIPQSWGTAIADRSTVSALPCIR